MPTTTATAIFFIVDPSAPNILRTALKRRSDTLATENPCETQGRQLVTRQQKITLGEMRSSGVRGLLVYCADYKCAHAR